MGISTFSPDASSGRTAPVGPLGSTEPGGAVDAFGALEEQLGVVRARLAGLGSVLVAFSGGVDSSVLAALALEVLGDRAVACTATSPTLPADELDGARSIADLIGIRHRVIHTNEMAVEAYAANPPDRCYACKGVLLAGLRGVAAEEGVVAIVYGEIADDLTAVRPGRRALVEAGAVAPLAEAGLTKADVREAARRLGLPVASKPAAPCLATRIPYGERITPERLGRIGAAEALLHRLDFDIVRVRDHGSVARIEVPLADLARLLEPATRDVVVEGLRALGYRHVTTDLAGFVSGSFDRALAAPNGPPQVPVIPAGPASFGGAASKREGD